MSRDRHVLFLELFGDFPWTCTGDFNPCFREHCTRGQHECDVDSRVDGVEECSSEVQRWRHVVCQSADSMELATAVSSFPYSDEFDEEVVGVAVENHLRNEEDVGGECRLQHERHVGSIKEFDGIRSSLATEFD